jgi:hypothetical protein
VIPQKTIVIITDGTASTRDLAEKIGSEFRENRVRMIPAEDFSGTDILPADICFFGCEKPNPPSFAHLEAVLGHINLAGRPCGLFSPASPEAIEYLSGIVRDSELALCPKPLFASGAADVAGWIKNIYH